MPTALFSGVPLLQAVASLAWSYSTLKYDHPQLYECLAQEVLRMLGRDGGSGTDSEAGSSSSSSSSDSAAGGSSSSSSSNFVDGGSVVGHSNGSDASGADTQRRADSWRPGHAGAQAGGSAFVPQTVSVLLFAFAAANRLDSPAQRKVRDDWVGHTGRVHSASWCGGKPPAALHESENLLQHAAPALDAVPAPSASLAAVRGSACRPYPPDASLDPALSTCPLNLPS